MNVLSALLKGLTFFFDNLLREFSEILKPFQKIRQPITKLNLVVQFLPSQYYNIIYGLLVNNCINLCCIEHPP